MPLLIEQYCQMFKLSFDKNRGSNTDAASKPIYNLVTFLPFLIKIVSRFW